MIIKVTREHIARGAPSSPCACPVAIAVGEAIGSKVMVQWENISVLAPDQHVWDGHATRYKTPRSVREFMVLFDVGCFVAPFEFELEVEDK